MVTKLLQIYIPEEVFWDIEKVAKNFSTRSSAVQHILRLGLDQIPNQRVKK